MDKRQENLDCPTCRTPYDLSKYLPRNLGGSCKHAACDNCIKEALKKMKSNDINIGCLFPKCLQKIIPPSKYMSNKFPEDVFTIELLKKQTSDAQNLANNPSSEHQNTDPANIIKPETSSTKIEPQNSKTIKTESSSTKIDAQKSGTIQSKPSDVKIEGIKNEETQKPSNSQVQNSNNAQVSKNDAPSNNPTKMNDATNRNHEVILPTSDSHTEDDSKAYEENMRQQIMNQRSSNWMTYQTLDPMELKRDITKSLLEGNEELQLKERMSIDSKAMVSRRTSKLIPRKYDEDFNSILTPTKIDGFEKDDSLHKSSAEQRPTEIKSPEGLFSASLIQHCHKRVKVYLNDPSLSLKSNAINHFPKSFDRKESNMRNIMIENWFFSRKIIPNFFTNCIQFSRSSTSKGTSLHTVMDTAPILKETLIKITLLKYDASESSHFGFCDKSEEISLQENKMRFNPDQPHCYITDGYSKFKISENEFSALSWKSSQGPNFQTGDEIYIHVIPKRSIIFYLKRQNISIKYSHFDTFCDIRFFMTIVVRTNVFEYQQLI